MYYQVKARAILKHCIRGDHTYADHTPTSDGSGAVAVGVPTAMEESVPPLAKQASIGATLSLEPADSVEVVWYTMSLALCSLLIKTCC